MQTLNVNLGDRSYPIYIGQRLLEQSTLLSEAIKGNTVLIIEHKMDIIMVADHVIDLGPDGGDAGGRIVAEGTPEEVANIKESITGKFLQEELK